MLGGPAQGGREAEVVGTLEEDIIFGRLAPGARLTEDALLARFPVTRHFIRQALLALERKGIVTRERNKGATVRAIRPEELRQIYEVRELLQREAARLIPLPASAELIRRLEQIHAEYCAHVERGFLRGVHELNDRFHLAMFGASGNAYLVESIVHYMRLTLPVRAKTLADPARLAASREDHRRMIELLAGTDREALAELCVAHLLPSKLEYLAEVEARQDRAEASAA